MSAQMVSPRRVRGGICPQCKHHFEVKETHFRYVYKRTPFQRRLCNTCYFQEPAVRQKRAEIKTKKKAEAAEKKAREEAMAAEKKAREEAEAAEKVREEAMCALKL